MRQLIIIFVTALSGCIISVTSQRACDAERPCPEGASCNTGACIPDDLLYLGEQCSESRQCFGRPEVACTVESRTCEIVCGQPLRLSEACIAGEYCKPAHAVERPSVWIGVCVGSECMAVDDCWPADAGLSCVSVASEGKACLRRCEITGTGAAFADDCGGTDEAPAYCQPVGLADRQALVCLDRVTSEALAPEVGAACDPVGVPCQTGAACVLSAGELVCRAYCATAHGDADCTDPGSPHCCAVLSGDSPLYAICQPDAC